MWTVDRKEIKYKGGEQEVIDQERRTCKIKKGQQQDGNIMEREVTAREEQG